MTTRYADLAAEREKVAQLESQLRVTEDGVVILQNNLAAAQAVIEQMRNGLRASVAGLEFRKQHVMRHVSDAIYEYRMESAIEKVKEILALPANLDALHEDRARECERLKVICEEGFSEFLPNTGGEYALKCMSDILSQEAADHRAKKGEGK